ncbi:MAG: hypothetical protein ACLPID_15740 [Beijerinckiaceae bacterium]
MQSPLKLTLVAAAACLLGTATAVQSMAQSGPAVRADSYAVSQDRHYSNYQAPDGSYDSPRDFIRDLEGTPCGIDCTQRAQQRWSR